MSADAMQLDASADTVTLDQPVRVRMKARSANAVRVFRGLKLAHDLSGMSAPQRIPIDYEHDTPIGYADTFTQTADGLEVAGAIIPTGDPADPARRIIALARSGVPWEASIEWRPIGPMERIEAGQAATVNGRMVEGPAIVARKWSLRAVAVAKLGADDSTRTELMMSEGNQIEVNIMAEQPNGQDSPVDQDVGQPEASQAGQPDSGQSPQPDAGSAKLSVAEMAAPFLSEFGEERGAIYFARGLSLDQARQAEIAYMREQLAAARSQQQRSAANPVVKTTPTEAPVRLTFEQAIAKVIRTR